jgi:hypothetical protein
MAMTAEQIVPGVKFVDNDMESHPEHHRVHKILQVRTGKPRRFVAVHLATDTEREMVATKDQLAAMDNVPDYVIGDANVDTLVGEKVKLHLSDTGTITGVVTSVHYHKLTIGREDEDNPDKTLRQLSAIELDGTGSNRYPLAEIAHIERLS